MEYFPKQNLLLEALAYLGRRSGGYTVQWLIEWLEGKGASNLEGIRSRLEPIAKLMSMLDEAINAKDLVPLFSNLSGFPYNPIGAYSPAFLLLYPLVADFDGNLERTAAQSRARPAERLAADLDRTLDISEESARHTKLTGNDFSARILSLSVPAESKVAILDLYHRPESVLAPAMEILTQVMDFLKGHQAMVTACCASFVQELRREGAERFLARTSSLTGQPDRYQVHPFLFGLDTNLAVTPTCGPVRVYCGILRQCIQESLNSARGPEYEVYDAYRLLADQTRFDIVCYLRNREAYGQELAAKFGLSRNTIHHHMTRLLAAHLVKCTVDGNRVYYTVDRQAFAAFLDRQRRLLLPEDLGSIF